MYIIAMFVYAGVTIMGWTNAFVNWGGGEGGVVRVGCGCNRIYEKFSFL